jgi:hypothetical protein
MLANRIGLVLATLGAAVIMAAACLVRIVDGGWMLIASSIAVGASALWVSRGNHRGAVLPVAVCVVTSVPVLAGASLQRGSVSLLPHAIAAVGLVIALAGSLLLARRPAGTPDQFLTGPTPSEFRSIYTADGCPRCARPVGAAARTCNYCGFAMKRYRRR